MIKQMIGLDLGGTSIKAVKMTADGQIIKKMDCPTHSELGIQHVLEHLAEIARQLMEFEKDGESVDCIGMTVPGVLRDREVIELMPNFPDLWKGVPLKLELERMLGTTVELLNDARAAAYGEFRFGSAKGESDVICLTLGTGVGGGIIHQGNLLLGSRGVAGEVGHQVVDPGGLRCGCGNQGCLETVASGPAIISEAIRFIKQGMPTMMRQMTKGDLNAVTPKLVNDAVKAGDQAAIAVFERAAYFLVRGLHNLIALLNPRMIVISGGLCQADRLMNLVSEQLSSQKVLLSEKLGRVQIVKAKA